MTARCLLVTGATGKVGRHFLGRFLSDSRFVHWAVRALCHHRSLEPHPRVSILQGTISDRNLARQAMAGVTHVVHLATCKETPEEIMDVAIKGMFWLLEEARISSTLSRFLLVGGDAAVGHFHFPHALPVTEQQRHTAYPGCYALSKVLEEVMLEQYAIQYGLDVCCLRAPWIMEKDDFKYQLSFGEDVFGAPRWRELVGTELAEEYQTRGTVPVLLDRDGQPVLRNFVHVDDLADALLVALEHPNARQQTFNICMNEPVNYREVAAYLERTRELPSVKISTSYHSTWLDNSKARFQLGWRPKYDVARLIDEAYAYQRSADDPRRTWYPG